MICPAPNQSGPHHFLRLRGLVLNKRVLGPRAEREQCVESAEERQHRQNAHAFLAREDSEKQQEGTPMKTNDDVFASARTH